MDRKLEVLKLINEYAVQENSSTLDKVIEQHDFDELAGEIVKLFLISPVISLFVCGHPPKQVYLNDGVWHCEKCGGKWNSIANKL